MSNSYLLEEREQAAREIPVLSSQAESFFPFEIQALTELGWTKDVSSLVDLGAGSGASARLLAEHCSFGQCTLVDRNHWLLQEASLHLPKSAQLIQADLLNASQRQGLESVIDGSTVLLRFVAQHLSSGELDEVLRWIRGRLGRGKLAVIDVDDRGAVCEPDDPLWNKTRSETIEFQSGLGGDRTVASSLARRLARVGFQRVDQRTVDVGSRTLGWARVKSSILPSYVPNQGGEALLQNLHRWADESVQKELVYPIHLFVAEL
jgi:predicted O-methyltransferase YrrM